MRRRLAKCRRNEGAVLLMVILVVSILLVLIGQFSYSVSLDRALAENHLRDTQARLDLRSAAEVFRAAVGQGLDEPRLTCDLASGTAVIQWVSEAGKLNLNLLREEDSRIAQDRLERLFRRLEDDGTVTELGLVDQITEFVLSSERPLLSIRELEQIDGISPEVIDGAAGKKGLADFLTVYSDGQVNIADAPVEVIASLDETLDNDKVIDMLRRKLEDPATRVPDYISRLARSLKESVTTDSECYRAVIRLSGDLIARQVEVVVRKENDSYRILLYNERSEPHEQFAE